MYSMLSSVMSIPWISRALYFLLYQPTSQTEVSTLSESSAIWNRLSEKPNKALAELKSKHRREEQARAYAPQTAKGIGFHVAVWHGFFILAGFLSAFVLGVELKVVFSSSVSDKQLSCDHTT